MPSNLTPLRQTQTPARISLGQTGPSIPTTPQLNFQLDHALARDAVHTPLDLTTLTTALTQRNLNPITVQSAVPPGDRQTYLRRPDLGRTLSPASADHLRSLNLTANLVILLADGLSALALERHAIPLLDAFYPLHPTPYTLVIATQARVALGDPIGELLHAQLTVTLIGERPGLSSPDSLGAYITWHPRPGRTDAERNCISNIRLEGLSYTDAAHRILFYLNGAQRLQATGISLKETLAL